MKTKWPTITGHKHTFQKGGEGSGNFGHEGRPGEVGGSGGGGGGTASSIGERRVRIKDVTRETKPGEVGDKWNTDIKGLEGKLRGKGFKVSRLSNIGGKTPAFDLIVTGKGSQKDLNSILSEHGAFETPVHPGKK